nr:hypothetical protein [Tanacetum cinerariifolium]
HLRRPAPDGARPARVFADALGLRGLAALRGGYLERRHWLALGRLQKPDSGGAEFLALGRAVLDHRHRRLCRGAPLRAPQRYRPGRVARAKYALVPIRGVLPAVPGARAVPVPRDLQRGARRHASLPEHALLRPAALPPATLPLLALHRRPKDDRRRAARAHAALRARRRHRALRPGRAVHRREAYRPHHALRVHGPGWEV